MHAVYLVSYTSTGHHPKHNIQHCDVIMDFFYIKSLYITLVSSILLLGNFIIFTKRLYVFIDLRSHGHFAPKETKNPKMDFFAMTTRKKTYFAKYIKYQQNHFSKQNLSQITRRNSSSLAHC